VYLRQDGKHDDFVQSLKEASQPALTLDVSDLYQLGAEFYRWEFAAAIACSILGVNAFDQPDVQDNKDRTKKKLQAFFEMGELKENEPIWAKDGYQVYGIDFSGLSNSDSLSEVIKSFITLAEDDDYIAINAYVPRNEKNLVELTALRENIIEAAGCATTLGFGPRFLHSTGQLHKGGANNGLFIQITQENAEDIDIPGKAYSFSTLVRAQAQGDLEALLARDRRAIRVHLNSDDTFTLLD
jgi:transaldolase/glucose-6-phosphate isomerase